jgi:hypothetical protein
MTAGIDATHVPGLTEGISALVEEGLSDHYAEHLAKIVLRAATMPILSAAFADAADDLRDMPGLRTAGQTVDLLEQMSHHIETLDRSRR